MNTTKIIHSLLAIDENGTIVKKYFTNTPFNYDNIKDALDVGSINYYNSFIQTLLSAGYSVGNGMSFNINGQYVKLILNGIKINEIIYIFSVYDYDEALTIELQSINNDLINTLRNTIKKISECKKGEGITEEKFLEEMTILNNQLINMQRELVKKNIEIQNLNEKLQKMAITDPLTGAFNRRYFYQKLGEEITRAKRNNYTLSIIYIDLNNFKTINDTYGHEEGDRVLIEFTQITKNHIRNNIDSLFRFGGDEFVILLIDCNEDYAQKVAVRLNNEISKIHTLLSMAYGISEITPETQIDIEKIISATDQKMYEHKKKMKMH